MKESRDPIVMPEQAQCTLDALFDRSIAALTFVDVDALMALQQECDLASRGALFSLDPCGQPMNPSASTREKHQVLAKLLVQTRQNLRVLHQVCEGSATYVPVASPDRRERGAWQL